MCIRDSVVAVGFVLLAGLLGSLEAALARVSRVRVEELAREGRSGAGRLQQVMSDPPRSLNLLLLLRVTLELAATGVVVSYCVDRIEGSLAVVVAVAVMTLVIYVFVGVGPRTIGRQQAERVALGGAGVALLLTRIFGPLPTLLILIGNALTPGKGFREGPFSSEAELRDLVEIAQERGVVERSERDMINSVFELGDTIVREVMVPRPDIVVIERGKTVRQALNLALRSGFSRIPVVGENADDVLGVAYLKDLVRKERSEGGGSVKVEEAMREPVFVPESKPIDVLLREMQAQLGHIAVVVDEYGGTAGLVTVEDLLEELVGEIRDEYDVEAEPIVEEPGDAWVFSAKVDIDELTERLGVDIEREGFETIGGYLMSRLGRVPAVGEHVIEDGLDIEVLEAERRRVLKVRVRRLLAEGDQE